MALFIIIRRRDHNVAAVLVSLSRGRWFIWLNSHFLSVERIVSVVILIVETRV